MTDRHVRRRAARPAKVALARRALLKGGAAGLVLPALASRVLAKDAAPQRVVTSALAGTGSPFVTGCDARHVTSLMARGAQDLGDLILAGGGLGQVKGTLRTGGEASWRAFDTAHLEPVATQRLADALAVHYALGAGLELIVRLALDAAGLAVTLDLHNAGCLAVELGDLVLPLPINELQYSGGKDPAGVLKHSFISGHGSHIFWQRKDVKTPWLAMFPQAGSALEYWEAKGRREEPFAVYFHAAAQVAAVQKAGSRWRLPASSLGLEPGQRAQRGVVFALVEGYAAMRQAIIAQGLVDVEVVPGMTVPSDLEVMLSLGSRIAVTDLEAEHPAQTQIKEAARRAGRQLFRVAFSRLGENHLTLVQANGARTTLEFFVTEPVETLIAKRGAFLARHQHTDPAKWYNGLLAEWNMQSQTLLGPDNYDRIKGWRIYEVTCDDPGLSKPAFLATKLAEYPVQSEIDALDRYVEHFVWGGLQQTTQEPYPYGIYGIPDWKQNRESHDTGPKGQKHLWRVYDYPHIVVMYFGLYRVARDHPATRTRLSAEAYLERAFGTARAMFTVPKELVGWDADNIGYYNEIVIPDLIAALDAEGRAGQAAELRGHWEHKVHHFVEEVEDLFVSEYAFDSTGFESTQAMARYALDRPDTFPPERAGAFCERQMQANLFCRGWLEPSYYYLGSDYRGQGGDAYTLTYMAQMGGWGVLDYALNDAREPHELLRLGHASVLSSWALLNSGTAQSNYGYWYPGKANDGGAGGGFEPAALGHTWLDQPHWHGSWYYSCEIDLGFCGGVRAAATTLSDDPLFGRIALGGTLETAGDGGLQVWPRDGVRRRLHVRLEGLAYDLCVAGGARLAGDRPVAFTPDARGCRFTLEHDAGPGRSVRLHLGKVAAQQVCLRVNGQRVTASPQGECVIPIATDTTHTEVTLTLA